MNETQLLAQLLGILLLILGVSMAVRRSNMLEVMSDFMKDKASLMLGAILSLTLGLFIVLTDNNWSGNILDTVVTIIGWLMVLRGVMWLFLPDGLMRKLFGSVKKEQSYFLAVLVVIILGLYLTFAGFSA